MKKNNVMKWISIAIVLMLVSGIGSTLMSSSFGKVSVEKIEFNTDAGSLTGLLYIPDGVDADNPAPTIITTHGYLNAKEMQDAPAIELSRRGFVVLALDMYEHGDSHLNEVSLENPFFSFWTTSVFDATVYMYQQPYVLKDESGNGMIAVSGHSMGGFSTIMAAFMDESQYLGALAEGNPAVRMIHAALPVGADFNFTTYLGVDAATFTSMLGGRTFGMIGGEYDEFFYNAVPTTDTMTQKDYIVTADGQTVLENTANAEYGEFYNTSDGGKRVIYQPNGTHPWNHFSIEATGYEIDFYNEAFSSVLPSTEIDASSQVWRFKEYFEFLGLIGFFMFFIPFIRFMISLPMLNSLQTKVSPEFESPRTSIGKIASYCIIVISVAFPAMIYAALFDKRVDDMKVLGNIAIVIGVIAVATLIFSFVKKLSKSSIITSGLAVVLSGILYWLINSYEDRFVLSAYLNAPVANSIIYWAIVVSTVATIILLLMYALVNNREGINFSAYGLGTGLVNIVKAFVVAVAAAVVAFAILQIINRLFNSDFRLWVVAVRAFNKGHLVSAIRYMPLFFIYYFTNGIAIQINTNSKSMKGIKGYLLAFALNVGGLVLFLIIQYGGLFATGTAPLAYATLSSIVIVSLTVILFVATIFTKKLLDITNNVYLGAFLNTIVFTITFIASTTVYTNLI